jgi:hypothetical protein
MSTEEQTRAIIHPQLDPWLVGGLSIVVLGIFLVFSSTIPRDLIVGDFLILTVLLNGTHFMASYLLLYSSKENVYRYRAAALYMPIGLMSVGALGLILAAPPYENGVVVQGIMILAALYLALHYTGQAWGMMASYAYLHGIRFEPIERRRLRLCLRTMAVWQMAWSLTLAPAFVPTSMAESLNLCMKGLNVVALISLIVGATTLKSISRRLNARLPISMVLPFATLYVWYVFLSVYPQALFWVQISHAVQYLSFPARVEINRASSRGSIRNNLSRWKHLGAYSLTLIVASFIVFFGIDKGLNYPTGGFEVYWLVICSLINIHHYFIDGCVWHISNPEVRADLFAHLGPPGSITHRH